MLKFFKAFTYAAHGWKIFIKTQRNARVHAFITLLVLAFGYSFHISKLEWIVVLICIALVMVTEILNTAMEFLCDLFSKEQHPEIKKIKDLSAGAVLFAAIIAVVIGCIIFIPYLLNCLK